RLNLSQRQMLDLVGLGDHHHAFVSMWERGHREPPLMALLSYARSIGVSTDVLIDDDLDLPSEDKSRERPAVKRKKKLSPGNRAKKKAAGKKAPRGQRRNETKGRS